MHAVVVRVSIRDVESAQKTLEERVVPRISQAPGFVAAYWTRSADGSNGQSMLVFESAEAAQEIADQLGSIVPEVVRLESTEVREVVASA
jgi:hypothetical protein